MTNQWKHVARLSSPDIPIGYAKKSATDGYFHYIHYKPYKDDFLRCKMQEIHESCFVTVLSLMEHPVSESLSKRLSSRII